MKQIWAANIDTDIEISSRRQLYLGRYLYKYDPGDGCHARWEAEDGPWARSPSAGDAGQVFIDPRNGAVGMGEVAEKMAAEYRASLVEVNEPVVAVAGVARQAKLATQGLHVGHEALRPFQNGVAAVAARVAAGENVQLIEPQLEAKVAPADRPASVVQVPVGAEYL